MSGFRDAERRLERVEANAPVVTGFELPAGFVGDPEEIQFFVEFKDWIVAAGLWHKLGHKSEDWIADPVVAEIYANGIRKRLERRWAFLTAAERAEIEALSNDDSHPRVRDLLATGWDRHLCLNRSEVEELSDDELLELATLRSGYELDDVAAARLDELHAAARARVADKGLPAGNPPPAWPCGCLGERSRMLHGLWKAAKSADTGKAA